MMAEHEAIRRSAPEPEALMAWDKSTVEQGEKR